MPQPRKPREPLGPADGNGEIDKRIAELEKQVAVRDAQIEHLGAGLKECAAERDRLRARVDELQAALTDRERQIGELQAKAGEADRLRTERDDLSAQLSQERADADRRTADAVQQALAQATEQHKAEIDRLEQEKAGLQSQVDALQRQLEGQGVTGRVAPSALAGQFAAVLDQHAAPEGEPGRPFAAALTGLEVQARGVLEAPREGEAEPVLRTVEAGAVEAGHLSTVTMRFSLLPQGVPPGEQPPPEA
jgi:uncharacterized coiled-coil protein SlyX